MKRKLKKKLEKAGFQFMHTGGNCTAWHLQVGDEYVLIADDASADLESPLCYVGAWDSNDEEIRHTLAPLDQVVEVALSIVDLPEGYGLCEDCGFVGRTGVCDKCRRGVAR